MSPQPPWQTGAGEHYLVDAIKTLKKHGLEPSPVLLAGYMLAAAIDFHAAIIGNRAEDIIEALKEEQ